MSEVIIRPATTEDHAFVIDSAWRSIVKHPISEFNSLSDLTTLLESLLSRWPTLVAVDPTTDQIMGWLLYRDTNTVAWAFTKPWCRRNGICRALLKEAGISPSVDVVFPSTVKVEGYTTSLRPFLCLS